MRGGGDAMRFIYRCLTLTVVALLLLAVLASCSGAVGDPTPYAGEHVHTYGPWQDAAETAADGTVRPAGEIRYCKICHAEERR